MAAKGRTAVAARLFNGALIRDARPFTARNVSDSAVFRG
jgi:hypothetical protein